MTQNDSWYRIVAKPLKKKSLTAAVVELLQREPSLDPVMDMALGSGTEDFRASRCVAVAYEWNRPLFLAYRFVSDFGRVTQHGVRRIYGSLMMQLLERGEYAPDHEEAERLAEAVCGWSIEPGVKMSNLLWTLSILSHLSRQVEWAGDMVQQLAALNEADRSPGMRVLLRRIHKSLK